jgi:hypothetical protein
MRAWTDSLPSSKARYMHCSAFASIMISRACNRVSLAMEESLRVRLQIFDFGIAREGRRRLSEVTQLSLTERDWMPLAGDHFYEPEQHKL